VSKEEYRLGLEEFKFDVCKFELPKDVHLGLIDTSDGSDTVVMVK
jgi:hypothetical protein